MRNKEKRSGSPFYSHSYCLQHLIVHLIKLRGCESHSHEHENKDGYACVYTHIHTHARTILSVYESQCKCESKAQVNNKAEHLTRGGGGKTKGHVNRYLAGVCLVSCVAWVGCEKWRNRSKKVWHFLFSNLDASGCCFFFLQVSVVYSTFNNSSHSHIHFMLM